MAGGNPPRPLTHRSRTETLVAVGRRITGSVGVAPRLVRREEDAAYAAETAPPQ